MIDLMEFTNEELLQAVELIPVGLIREFFKQNPKTLNRIKPGFRAAAIPQSQYCPLLVKAINDGDNVVSSFVSAFLEKSIKELADKEIATLETKELVELFAGSLFSNCVGLYYKIANIEIEVGKLDQLQLLVSMYREWGRKEDENNKRIAQLSNENDELREELSDSKKAKKKLQEQLDSLAKKLEAITTEKDQVRQEKTAVEKQLEEKTELLQRTEKALKDKEKEYKKQLENIDRLKSDLRIKDDRINELVESIKEFEAEIARLKEQIKNLQSETSQQMHEIIALKEEVDGSKSALEDAKKSKKVVVDFDYRKVDPKHLSYYKYKDYDEFHEEMGYKLEDLGVIERRELITACIERAAYIGRPIVSDRNNCELLANLLASVISKCEYAYIAYFEGVTLADVNEVLEKSGRVVYLDNFIGNFNETLLFPLLQKYNDKIIIISAMYNKMFRYLPQDILEYCSYLNFSREKIDMLDDWDPYQIEEMIVQDLPLRLENAATIVLESIMRDLRFSRSVCEIKSRGVENHIYTHAILIYEILPYMIEVLGVNPFKISERLLNYIQKSSYRQLVEKWFINE